MSLPPDVVDLIIAKRDGRQLTSSAITWLVQAYAEGRVPQEQMSALLMAIYFRGLDGRELEALMGAMIDSGERLDLKAVRWPTVDKHSTGGVGDKVSLILAPLVASCGAAVPQLSGRGLGHTGGTLDKLESIAGFRVDLSPAEMISILADVGCVIAAAGPGMAPADRRLYALRDVTGTVESIPLIATSIMSKKIAEGTSSLVLDVKVGNGAFMRDLDSARELAQMMIALGSEYGVRTSALLTRMDEPLGSAVGNALEVAECVETLRGGGPADLIEITLARARDARARRHRRRPSRGSIGRTRPRALLCHGESTERRPGGTAPPCDSHRGCTSSRHRLASTARCPLDRCGCLAAGRGASSRQ